MPSIDRRLARHSAPARRHLLGAGALGATGAALIVAQASLLASVIARAAVRHASVAALRPSIIALACVLLARAVIDGGFELVGRLGATSVMSQLREQMIRRLIIEHPESRPRRLRTGELATLAVSGVDSLEAYFAGYLPQLILATLVPLACIGWISVIDPVCAAILALTVPLLIVFMVLVGNRSQERAHERWRALALLSAHFLDVVHGLATLRAYRREHAQQRTLAVAGERYRAETMSTLRIAMLSALVLELCAMIGTALVAASIGVQLVAGALSLQAGLTVLLLAPEVYQPLRQVGQQFHASVDGTTAAGRILDTLQEPPVISHSTTAIAPPNPALHPIRFRAVSYTYPGQTVAALKNIDLTLTPGHTTALLGSSGAGKSTLVALLLRLADPLAGSLTCGGVDLREIDPAQWRRLIAWVPQRPRLFTATVAENIALASSDATRRQIIAAARAAQAEEFIRALPAGLDTVVGEGARRLSAGQAQRIALARALLSERPLLILDEPTAHLDEHSAAAVLDALASSAVQRTVLLIVHDLRLSGSSSQIHHLRDGRLLDTATAGQRGQPVGARAS